MPDFSVFWAMVEAFAEPDLLPWLFSHRRGSGK
jgi:hypothetical protein